MAKIHLTSKTSAMKLYLPLIASALILASCSTAYKTGQTPDDVYYSPERQRDEYVRVKEKDDREYRDQLQSEEEWREDRYLRMKTSYRRYSALDDYDCYCYTGSNYNRYYDLYRYNNWGYYNPTYSWYNRNWNNFNSYYYNPYYNKPYYSGYVVGNVVTPVYNKPRKGNLSVYGNNDNHNVNIENSNGKRYSNSSSSTRDDNYRGSGTSAGGFLRNVFGTSSNNNSSSTNSPSTNSSSRSSSESSNSSSNSAPKSAPARKF
jgi:hypothetical protein